MREILLTLVIGIAAGVVDILPMIKMKLPKSSIISAFAFYLIAPFIIFNINGLDNIWIIKGGIITLALAIPVVIMASKDSKKDGIPIIIMSIILGSIIGIVGHFLDIM